LIALVMRRRGAMTDRVAFLSEQGRFLDPKIADRLNTSDTKQVNLRSGHGSGRTGWVKIGWFLKDLRFLCQLNGKAGGMPLAQR
jgi:hypothetical protein